MIRFSVEDIIMSSIIWRGWALSSDIKEHINFMAKGTCPQICAICAQSAVLAFGSNSETRVLAEALSNGLILKPLWPWKWRSINSRDSLVVTTKVTIWFCLRISSRSCMTSSFAFGEPLSNQSSKLSRINADGFETLLKSCQTSSSTDRHWPEGCFMVVSCLRRLRNFEAKSALERTPLRETQYTGIPWDWRACPTAIATDVFPNPGVPQIDTSRMDSEDTCPMISSHSLWRPVKLGTTEGREAPRSDDLTPLKNERRLTNQKISANKQIDLD